MRPENQRLALACAAASALLTTASAARAANAEPADDVPRVVLHVDAPADLEVYGRPSDDYEWVPVCRGACNMRVVNDWEYQVRGDGVRSSRPFVVSGAPGQDVTVHVEPASSGWFIGGLISVVGGAFVTGIGLDVLFVGAVWHSAGATDNSSGLQSLGGGALAAGAVITSVGLVALVGGGIAALSNVSTKVKREQSEATARFLPPAPTWRTLDARETNLPVPVGAPVLQVRF
jgi:hypothetical protein